MACDLPDRSRNIARLAVPRHHWLGSQELWWFLSASVPIAAPTEFENSVDPPEPRGAATHVLPLEHRPAEHLAGEAHART